jgi:cell division protease FtsH
MKFFSLWFINCLIVSNGFLQIFHKDYKRMTNNYVRKTNYPYIQYREIIANLNQTNEFNKLFKVDDDDEDDPFNEEEKNGEEEEEEDDRFNFNKKRESRERKSNNFEVITPNDLNFTNIGGYEEVKNELYQIVDLLKNPSKYSKYNVRVPKGLVFEGPPGNGKTYIAKALAGEAKTNFITVSGSEFQEKYVGVGSSRIRELFALAKKNKPCIVFIDEIDALGRKRTVDGEISASERDSTLNELLVALDGFNKINGVFVIGATNRLDLLDNALLRPGRIDKKIHIGFPNVITREQVINIHIKGKPHDNTVTIKDLIENTNGFSCAEIENLLNEAMLNALRRNRTLFTQTDLEIIMNKMLVGWQPIEHEFDENIINHIAVHEMGHAIMGMNCIYHKNVTKVSINLNSPFSPGYTVFEKPTNNIHIREELIEHLMILLSGRIAEELIYDKSVTTGAINDFEEVYKLTEKMVYDYGMGTQLIYSLKSEKYKTVMDEEIQNIINESYVKARSCLIEYIEQIVNGANLLKQMKTLNYFDLIEIINMKKNQITISD